MARIATALGVPDPPVNRARLAERLAAYRDELHATPDALATARFLLLDPPVPLLARLPYGVLAANAVSLLPPWASRELRVPRLPAEGLCVRPSAPPSPPASGGRWPPPAPPPDPSGGPSWLTAAGRGTQS